MSHLNRKAVLAGAALVAAAWATPTIAAPFVNVSLLGRVQGSGGSFSSTVDVGALSAGAVIEYEIVAQIAPIGTVNGTRTITALTPGVDGLNSHKWDIFENAAALTQVSFAAPGTLNTDPNGDSSTADSWAAGTGATGGVPTARAGGTGNDLLAIRPVHASGVNTALNAEVVQSGTFTLSTVNASAASLVQMRLAASGTGGGKVNNGATTLLISTSSESGTDPLTGYAPLTLTSVPEPTSLSLLGLGAMGLLARRRKA